jgi:hypothetical protein
MQNRCGLTTSIFLMLRYYFLFEVKYLSTRAGLSSFSFERGSLKKSFISLILSSFSVSFNPCTIIGVLRHVTKIEIGLSSRETES